MTREHKLSLIIGVTVVLLVFVLLTDHMSRERTTPLAAVGQEDAMVTDNLLPSQPIQLAGLETAASQPMAIGLHIASASQPTNTPDNTTVENIPEQTLVPEAPTTTSAFKPRTTTKPINRELAFQRASEMGTQFADAIKSSLENANAAQQTDTVIDPLYVDSTIPPPINTGGVYVDVTKTSPTQLAANTQNSEPYVISMDPQGRHHPDGFISEDEMVTWEFRTVRDNESLYAIAEEYYSDGNKWRRIADFNADKVGKNGSVRKGVKLRVPTGRAVASSSPTKAKASTPVKPAPKTKSTRIASSNQTREYTVKKNDTLGHIAQRELGSVKYVPDLLKANNIAKNDRILAGMTLQIPIH